jgi:hypothetical protein
MRSEAQEQTLCSWPQIDADRCMPSCPRIAAADTASRPRAQAGRGDRRCAVRHGRRRRSARCRSLIRRLRRLCRRQRRGPAAVHGGAAGAVGAWHSRLLRAAKRRPFGFLWVGPARLPKSARPGLPTPLLTGCSPHAASRRTPWRALARTARSRRWWRSRAAVRAPRGHALHMSRLRRLGAPHARCSLRRACCVLPCGGVTRRGALRGVGAARAPVFLCLLSANPETCVNCRRARRHLQVCRGGGASP